MKDKKQKEKQEGMREEIREGEHEEMQEERYEERQEGKHGEIINDGRQVESVDAEKEEKSADAEKTEPWYKGPIKWMISGFLLLLVLSWLIPAYGVKLDPRPTHFPEIDDISCSLFLPVVSLIICK